MNYIVLKQPMNLKENHTVRNRKAPPDTGFAPSQLFSPHSLLLSLSFPLTVLNESLGFPLVIYLPYGSLEPISCISVMFPSYP